MDNFDMENMDANMDNIDMAAADVEMPVEDVEITDDVISFGKHGKIKDKEYVAEAEVPVMDAVVVEDVPVEEAVAAPIAVEAMPEQPYNAPIEEPVHHTRWPWALLALPLLAIPFIHRNTVVEEVVAEPVVVNTPDVRSPAPTCNNGQFIVRNAVDLKEAATASSTTVQNVAANTAVRVTSAAEDGYYHVAVGTADGYLPVADVICQVASTNTPAARVDTTG